MNNLDLLDRKNPLLALELRCQNKKEVPFSDFAMPQEETLALYLSALGPPSWQEKILKWLENRPGRQIFLIPRDPHILHRLILPLIQHPKVLITSDFKPLPWKHLFKPWEVMGGNKDLIEGAILEAELTLSLYRDFGEGVLTNVFKNLDLHKRIKKGGDLKGQFNGIPAVICGAGPSLEKSFSELKEIQDRAVIIAGGSALAPLSRSHIPIHFAAAVDPDPPTERL